MALAVPPTGALRSRGASRPSSTAEAQAGEVLLELSEATTPRRLYLARARARELVERFGSCVTCRRAYARALDRSRMWADAARQWRALLRLEPDDEEALLALADYHMGEGLRYRTMVSGPLSLSGFAAKDLTRAVGYLERLVRLPGGHGAAHCRLAELALVLERWPEVVSHAGVAAFAGCHRGHALAGAALVRSGDLEGASREFALFFEASSDSIRALYHDPACFFARGDLGVGRSSPPADCDASSWDDRDPRLLTPENERLLEHFARLTIASVRCASRPGRWDGALTEQGVLIIRYGEPIAEVRLRPEIGDEGRLRPEELRYHYPEFTVALEDRGLLGWFHLCGGGKGDSLSLVEGVRIIRRVRERYDPHGGKPSLPMAMASWLLPRSPWLVVVALDIGAHGVQFHWDGSPMPEAHLAMATRWREAERGDDRRYTERLVVDELRGCPDSPRVGIAVTETLSVGTWRLSLEVEDRSTGLWARRDTTLLVPRPSASRSLGLFGPIPCWNPTGTPAFGHTLEDSPLLPTPDPRWGARDPLLMYFEVHGLAPTSQGGHEATITYSVRPVARGPWWRTILRRPAREEVSVEIEAHGPGTSLHSGVEVRLLDPAFPRYEFTLRCLDEVGGTTAEGQAVLRVCEPVP